jgi:hypothetical protein
MKGHRGSGAHNLSNVGHGQAVRGEDEFRGQTRKRRRRRRRRRQDRMRQSRATTASTSSKGRGWGGWVGVEAQGWSSCSIVGRRIIEGEEGSGDCGVKVAVVLNVSGVTADFTIVGDSCRSIEITRAD